MPQKLNLPENNNYGDEERVYISENNCDYFKEMRTPYLVHTNGTTKIIVQTSFYNQTFMTTKCLNSNSSTPDGEKCFKGILSGAREGSCKTKYTSIIVYAYNVANKKIQRVPIELPVCCYCGINSESD
ncbi:uncharacterized protein LOC115440689 [Manduca sexta]|uniref:uncharacterized protein LOC115440689 n=1 Tax=Manduca sexta TaxID=7130 RepID=UPI00188E988E|nr:uncharacterized protein LOC115440689 [Manduca sexta]